MKENIVKNKSFLFAVRIVKQYQYLSTEKNEYVLSKQIFKSGTSIGANVEEADRGISRSDFSFKISIAYKESRETHYWLRLLKEAGYINNQIFNSLIEDCNELQVTFFHFKDHQNQQIKINENLILITHYSLNHYTLMITHNSLNFVKCRL